jgi:hypothetical protein
LSRRVNENAAARGERGGRAAKVDDRQEVGAKGIFRASGGLSGVSEITDARGLADRRDED